MKKRLLVTSTDLMMIQFLVPHVKNLSEHGYEVEIACSNVGGRMDEIRDALNDYVEAIHVVRLVRSPVSPTNVLGYQDMKKIVNRGNYDLIWTNEPVMGVVTRLAARKVRKHGTKVLYMVHGFHFYKGAPKRNWMVFYPIEWMMSFFSDIIVTVNKEDYKRAKKLHSKNVKYIHGIGINTDRLTIGEQKTNIRKELGLKENDFIVVSVGELNENKNQKTIIKAIARLKNPNIHYILCGKGDQLGNLQELAKKYRIDQKVHFLGYRTDVVDICSQANVFAMPSYREGLPVASLEAMYCGLPLVTSNIRGLVDVMKDGISGYLCEPEDDKAFAKGIYRLEKNKKLCEYAKKSNKKTVRPYCLEAVKKEIIHLMDYCGE